MADFNIPTWEESSPVVNNNRIPTWEESSPVTNRVFSPSKKSWQSLRNAFDGDPLMFIDDPQIRANMRFVTGQSENPDTERKKWALAAYFAQMRKEEIAFCHANLDQLIEKFNGGNPQSVDAAYADIGNALNFRRGEKTFYENRAVAATIASAGRVGEGAFNLARFILGTAAEFASAGARADVARHNPDAVGLLREPEEVRQNVEKAVMSPFEKYIKPDILWAEENMQLPADWVTNSGSLANWTENAAIAFINYVPQLGAQTALMAATGGTSALTAVFGINAYYGVKDDHPEMSEQKAILYGTAIGLINGGLEKVTMGMLSGKVSKKVAEEGVKKGIKSAIAYFAKGAAKESLEEGAEQIAENITDIAFGLRGDKSSFKASDWAREIFKGVPESMFVSLPVGAAFSSAGYRSARDIAIRQESLRNIIADKVQELSQRNDLSDEEEAQFSALKVLDESASTADLEKAVDMIALEELFSDPAQEMDEETKELKRAESAEKRVRMRSEIPYNPQDVIDNVAKYSNGFKDTVFHVVESWEDVKDKVPADAPGRSFIDLKTGDVYINASKVRPHEVFEVMLHETVGHKGLREVFKGEAVNTLLDQVYLEHFNEEEFKKVARRYFDLTELTDEDGNSYFDVSLENVEDQRLAAEEYIAHLAEQETKPSWWKEFLQKIRMALAKLPYFKNVAMTDEQINLVLARSARKMRRGFFDRRSRVETDGNGLERIGTEEVRFSVDGNGRPYYEIPFADSVDKVLNNDISGDGLIFVRDTPAALRSIGVPALPIMITRRHIKDIYKDNAPAGKNAHNMGEQLKALPEMLEKPVAVIAAEQEDRIIVITQYRDKSGNDIMVPVIIGDETTAQGDIRLTANIAASAYGKQSVPDMLNAAIKKENSGEVAIFGANKKIASKLSLRDLQLVQWSGFEAVHNINDKNSPVKLKIKDNSKSLQFKKWFGKSKVVDQNGEPMKVYHGTDRYGFSVFREDSHFTSSREYAARYANKGRKDTKSGVYEVYLSIQNPFDIRNASDRKIFTEYRQGHDPAQTKSGAIDWAEYDYEDLIEFLQENYPGKYDGVILDEGGDSADLYRGVSYIPFSPTQIKSATDNIGTFDPQNPDVRFSIAEYSADDQRDIVDILKPFTGTILDKNPEEYAAYLRDHGVDIPEKDAYRFAQEAAREKMKQARKAADKRRDNWLYDNILEYRWAVDFAGSTDFKIKLSPRFEKIESAGTFFVRKKDKGGNIISLEELAKHVARETGKDELEIEEDLFNFYRDLTKPALRKNYTDFKKEQFAADKEAAKQAFDEFMKQEQYRIEDEAVQILSAGNPITEEWINDNRKVFKALYSMIFKDKTPPASVSKRDLEAINAALIQEGANASTYAEAYKVAREKAYAEFQEKLKALREKVMQQKTDALALQREAASFAEKNLPVERRGEFTRSIINLLDHSNVPSTQYPDGRRRAEFDKIISLMTERAGEERKKSAVSEIENLLDKYKVMRTFKGIPVSKVPSVQNVMTEVRRITRMTGGAVNAYIGLQTAQMSQAEDGSQAWEDARKRAELAALFGNMQLKSADEAEEALKFLSDLVTKGKAEFREQLRDRLEKIKSMRNEVVRNLSGGVIDTTGKDADRFNKYLLKNRATLESFLRLTANTKIQDFDSTVQAQLVKEYEYAQEREKTQLRIFDQDFRKAVKDILGYDGLVGWKTFLDEINAPVSGVSRDVYPAEIKEGGMTFTLIGKRPAVRTKVNWKIAEYVLDKYDKDVNMVFQKIGVSHAREILKTYGEIKDDYAIFQIGEKFIVFSYDMDKTSVSEFEVPSQAIDRRIFGGARNVSDLARRFVRKQTDDVSAGVKPVDPEFGTEADDIQYQALSDLDKAASEVEFLSQPHNLKSSREEIPDLTINRAMQLILEWEQADYKDAFEWNGFTSETMQQLYDAVPEKYKRLAYWMRDYVNRNSDKLDQVAVKKYGVHLPRIPNYWMGAFSGSSKQKLSADNMLGAMSMNPSFLIARKGHLKAPDTNADAVAMFISHVWQQAHFVENNDAVSDLAAVFNDSKVKLAINNTLGQKVTDEILRRIKEYAAGGGTEKRSYDIIKKLLSFYAPAKVAFSIPSALKQVAGMAAYSYNMPLKEYLKYSGRSFRLSGDFKEFARFAWNSDFVQNRFAGGMDKDLVFLMNHAINSEKYSVFSSFLLDVGTLPLRGADTVAVILGGYPVYAYTRDQALAAGKTPGEAQKAAEYAWMKATNETQQSSNVTSKNYFMANYDGIFTLFRSNAIQTMDIVLRSIDEIKLGGMTEKTKRKLARQLVISHLIIPANMFLVSQLWSKGVDVEEWNWEDLLVGMLFGSWEGLFLADYAKKFTEKIVALTSGKPFYNPVNSGAPVLEDVISAVDRIQKLFGDKELEASDFAAAVKSLGDVLMVSGMAYSPAGILGSVLSAAGSRVKQVFKWFEED